MCWVIDKHKKKNKNIKGKSRVVRIREIENEKLMNKLKNAPPKITRNLTQINESSSSGSTIYLIHKE